MMSSDVSIMRLGEVLLAALQDELDDKSALRLAETVAEAVCAAPTTAVVLDIARLEIVDSFAAKVFGQISAVGGLLGARVVLAGMRPAVAITLVELGLLLAGTETALSVERALARIASPAPEASRGR